MGETSLKDQVAVVTGGAQGIGYAVAERLIAQGASVALWDLDMALANQSASELGATAVETDITQLASVEAALATTENALGPVSIAVNSAGLPAQTCRSVSTQKMTGNE